MRKLIKNVTFALLATTVILNATPRSEPGTYEIGAEFIYFQPLVENTFFGIQNTNPLSNLVPIGTRVRSEFDWQPGFRIEGSYTFCDCLTDLEVRWTRLQCHGGNSSSSKGGDVLLQTTGFPSTSTTGVILGTGTGSLHLKYNAVEALLGHWFWNDCDCDYNFGLQWGLHYADLKYNQDIHYVSPMGNTAVIYDVKNHSHCWGIGPELGLEMDYKLPQYWDCFPDLSIRGNFLGALLVSHSKPSFLNTATSQFLTNETVVYADVKNETLWRLIPMWDLRIGLGCTQEFWDCITADLEIGYEVLNYNRAIHTFRFLDTGLVGASTDEYTDLSFHGPYIALNLNF